MRVEFYRHGLGDEEIEELRRTLGSLFLSYGPRSREFEREFAHYLDVPHVVALNNCTNALFLCLKALDIGPGDEVITTPLSFVATSNVILHTGATHVFADVDPRTGNLDPARVEEAITERTRAIIVVHLYGRMVDMEAFKTLADRHDLHLIEDAAHCAEGSIDGVRPGQLGTAAAFSFYATKNLSSGEGGALATRDERLADRVHALAMHGVERGVDRHHGKFQRWDVSMVGYKATISDIQSALLLPQLRRIDSLIEKRNKAFDRYAGLIASNCGGSVSLPETLPGVRSAHHLFPIWCSEESRDELLPHLMANDIGVGVHYPPIHLTTYYSQTFGYRTGAFPVAEDLGGRCLSLPFFADITPEEQAYVVDKVREFYDDAG
jgi:UDP-4-amino-4-deoxy-L-arabinose-oxoglutarate aminotransferase